MNHPRFSLIDLLATAAAGMILLAVGMPLVTHAREVAYHIKCASNLKQIGLAILAYTRDNGGHYPRTVAANDPTTWTQYTSPLAPNPFAAGGPAPNDVTAAMFLLARTQGLEPAVFVCPATRNITPWDFGGGSATVLDRSNFPGGQHLSYSYANPYPSADAVAKGYRLNDAASAEFPVMADINPGADELLTVTANAPATRLKRVNSQNHLRGYGQIVLFGDGHAELLQSPFVGVQRDNIYTYGKSGASGGGTGIIGSPVDANDSVLLPVATVDAGSPRYGPGVPRPQWPLFAGLIAAGVLVCGLVILVRRWVSRRRPVASTPPTPPAG